MTTEAVRAPVGQLRVLTDSDLGAVRALLATAPVESVFIAARIEAGGLDAFRLGCPVWGWFRDNRLESVCHAGSNLIPFAASPPALEAFAGQAGAARRCSSIGGAAELTMPLWRSLCRQGADWKRVREVRDSQPLMRLDAGPAITPDRRVQPIERRDVDAYFDASVQMYTEEVGTSPFPRGSSRFYRGYVRDLIRRGHSVGICEGGEVIFKADIGSIANGVAQLQGVWVTPRLRGRGLAAPAIAAVVAYARTLAATVSLYVNDYNAPALAAYRRVGFVEVGRFATVLY